jgi:hypothetical protein
LRKAAQLGAVQPRWARNDPDLEPLRDDPEFERLFPANS